MTDELLDMLAAEAQRRVPGIKKGLKKAGSSHVADPEKVEELRVEVHGLKGAALVVGQKQLGRLAERAEQLLAAASGDGVISEQLAGDLTQAAEAFQAGAEAAAKGEPEPQSVPDALVALS